MAEQDKPRKYLEPGEIDKTRRNIGPIDPEEAAAMTKILGGEVLTEKGSGFSNADPIRRKKPFAKNSKIPSGGNKFGFVPENNTSESTSTLVRRNSYLPDIDGKEWAKMDRLMKSPSYGIRPNYGLFGFIEKFTRNGKEKVNKSYGDHMMKSAIEHMQAFITSVKTIIQLAPDTYKSKIAADPALKFKLLRTVGAWTLRELKVAQIDLESRMNDLTITSLITFTRSLYKQLVTIFYLGDERIANMFKEIFQDICMYPKIEKEKFSALTKTAITEWFFINARIVKETYPLLMRMCSPTFDSYPHFFSAKITNILQFVGISRFDILVPERKKKPEENVEVQEKKEEKPAPKKNGPGQMNQIVQAGIELLERLFPEAGFSKLDTMPDLYPYMDPIYDFDDGYNMLSPENPMQVVVVLLKILEDLFQGCRNIKFNVEADESLNNEKDNFTEAMNDFSLYREDLYDKHYNEHLKTFVNELYTKSDYGNTQYGKRLMSSILWETKYNFLPHFKFDQLLLERPTNDSKYRPLFFRTDFLRKIFTTLAARIDKASESKGSVLGILNPWDRYVFDIPNPISKRLDVLLGAKKTENSAATNANLLKYVLCILAVLDWWVNNEESPAYKTKNSAVYRISEKDGGPAFSVPMRTDQNQLFANSVKAALAKKD